MFDECGAPRHWRPRGQSRSEGANLLSHEVWCVFKITEPIDGKAATHANGGSIGLACDGMTPDRNRKSIEDPPGSRQGAAGKVLSRLSTDPFGNKFCAAPGPI
jgi:hypothetical protein